MSSLRARLGAGLIISLAGLFGLQWLVVSAALRSLTEDYVASRLAHDTTRLLALLAFDSNGPPVLDTARFAPLYHQPFSGHYFHMQTARGHTLRSRSLWDAALVAPWVPPGKTAQAHQAGPQGQLLVLACRLGQHIRSRERTLGITMARAVCSTDDQSAF